MKKILIIIGSIGILYIFISFILPNYVGIPLAAYESRKAWAEHEQKLNQEKHSDTASIFPKSIGIISDFGQVFTESQRTELSQILYDYDIETTRQIVIITIDSIKPYKDIQKYATDLGNIWGVGTAEKNNGLTIVMCNPCRQIGIATGTGTELILTDEICKNVIENIIIPKFKNEEYFDGIKNGLTELIEKWK